MTTITFVKGSQRLRARCRVEDVPALHGVYLHGVTEMPMFLHESQIVSREAVAIPVST